MCVHKHSPRGHTFPENLADKLEIETIQVFAWQGGQISAKGGEYLPLPL